MALLEQVARLEGQGLFLLSAADGLPRRDNRPATVPGSDTLASVRRRGSLAPFIGGERAEERDVTRLGRKPCRVRELG